MTDAALDDNGYVTATLRRQRRARRPRDRADRAHGHQPGCARRRRRADRPPRLRRGRDRAAPRAAPGWIPRRCRSCRPSAATTSSPRSGDTLLGADDKAGVAEIMAAVAHLAAHPELPRPDAAHRLHPGRGDRRGRDAVRHRALRRALRLHARRLGDRRAPGRDVQRLRGRSVTVERRRRPSRAGDRQARQRAAARRRDRRRAARRPADARDDLRPRGVHPPLRADRHRRRAPRSARSCATSTRTSSRDHVALLERTAEEVVGRRPARRARRSRSAASTATCAPTSTPCPTSSQAAEEAIRAEGIEPLRIPIRGGTDGSRLSEMGLPTPNIFTGGHEYHSVREWASVQDMAAAAATIVRLAEVWTQPEHVTRPARPKPARLRVRLAP